MLKKLTTLSLSLLLCTSVLPAQAGAMDAPENEPTAQVEKSEFHIPGGDTDENANAGIAPCFAVADTSNGEGSGNSGGPVTPPVGPYPWPFNP